MTEGQAMHTALSDNQNRVFDFAQVVCVKHTARTISMGLPDYTSKIQAEAALLMALEYLQDAQRARDADFRVLAALDCVGAIVEAVGLNSDALKPASCASDLSFTQNGGHHE